MKIDPQWIHDFAGRLRDARVAAGLSQSQAANLLELSQAFISLAESGQRMIEVPVAARMCDIYGISADWLLGLSDESNLSADLIEQTQKLPPADRYKLRKLLAMMG